MRRPRANLHQAPVRLGYAVSGPMWFKTFCVAVAGLSAVAFVVIYLASKHFEGRLLAVALACIVSLRLLSTRR